MFLAFLLAASAVCSPIRWPFSDPKTLDLLAGASINCLLLEQQQWEKPLIARARELKLTALGVVRKEAGAAQAASAGLDGIVLEGEFDNAAIERLKPAAVLAPRHRIPWDAPVPVVGTHQGLWPGIHVEKDGAARAAPTGAPWIDTNTGFLRFARALTSKPFWIANIPPPKSVFPVERYLQAIADAGAAGAQWVISLDEDFAQRLQAGDSSALRDWRRIVEVAKHFDSHPEWRSLAAAGQFAVVLDATAGAFVSGGVLDMVATRHTPVRPVPLSRLSGDRLEGAKVAVNIDPEVLTEEQKQILRRFAASGGTLLNAPPGWRFSTPAGALTLSKEDLEKLDSIWREVNSVTGRRNFGARLFNVSSMLSNLVAPAGGKQLVLHLVNYSNYPVEDITAHLLGKYSKATLYAPGAPPTALTMYPVEEGTGLEIPRLGVTGTVVIEP